VGGGSGWGGFGVFGWGGERKRINVSGRGDEVQTIQLPLGNNVDGGDGSRL